MADEEEARMRARLGIPASAAEVVVVTESSHWDPNWLVTSDTYYRWWVRPTLDRALEALVAEPRRVFSIEGVFFLDRYWNDRPQHQTRVRDLVNGGRLRLTGPGVTTPDTLLPDDELILRDLLVGQEWLRQRGMHAEPNVLYLPDSFGHSPGLPALLRAAGIEGVAVCRIDGMRFPGEDLEPAARFPRPDSSAAHLRHQGSADFVWRSGDGSEVLAHWMAHTYGHGDMVASRGLTRALALPLSWPDRRPASVDRRIQRYRDELAPLARTPYRLLAIGFDFVRPIPQLIGLLDAWNERHHERCGVWLVNAGVDDYLALVAHHRDRLPVIELDPNPYWMGFYSSRPELKARVRELGRRLIAEDVERAAVVLDGEVPGEDSWPAWWAAVTANHHDFVTGTSPDRVVRVEQRPLIEAAIARIADPIVRPEPHSPPPPPPNTDPPPSVRRGRDGAVEVACRWGTAVFDPSRGGAMVSLTDGSGGELVAGPSLELVSYFDSGGLWRMGQEIFGGRWAEVARTGEAPAAVHVRTYLGNVEIEVRARFDGHEVLMRHRLDPNQPVVTTHCSVVAPRRRTVTLAFRPAAPAIALTMHQPGGVVARPLQRRYTPTFWPLHSFAAVNGPGGAGFGSRFTVATGGPTGLHVDPDGGAQVVVARTAVKEMALGVVPVMAPAWGWRWGRQEAVVVSGWLPVPGGDDLVSFGRHLGRLAAEAAGHPALDIPLIVTEPGVEVAGFKPASRGPGMIVRLRDWRVAAPAGSVGLTLSPGRSFSLAAARLVDSRERDRCELTVTANQVVVPLSGHLTSVRLLTSGP